MTKVIAPITNIQLNKWALLGSYRENRERVDFYNQHTEVLKEMVDQRERDSHIASDIMKKRIKMKKAANVEEAGPDDKEFIRYLKKNKPQVSKLGVQCSGAPHRPKPRPPSPSEGNFRGTAPRIARQCSFAPRSPGSPAHGRGPLKQSRRPQRLRESGRR